MTSLATLDEFYTHGLRSELLVRNGRAVVSVDATANTITLPMHGAAADDPVRFSSQTTSGTLPGGLSASSSYYAIPVSDDILQVSATAGGAAVDLTTAGTGVILAIFSPTPRVQKQLEAASAQVQAALVVAGELVAPYPLEVVMVTCHIAALTVAASFGLVNAAQVTQDVEYIKARYDAAMKALERWRAGQRPAGLVDSTTDTSEDGAVSWGDASRCWTQSGNDGSGEYL